MKWKIIYLMLPLLSIKIIMAQDTGQSIKNYDIQGVVLDSLSKEKLFYANIALLNRKDSSFVNGSTTNEHGFFEIKNLKAGEYLLKASYIGYIPKTFPLNIKSSNTKLLQLDTLFLKPISTALGGVTIVEKKPVYAFDGEKMLYNVSEDPTIQTATLSDALQNAPGVEVDIEGNITLRGVSSVEIWINDKPSKLTGENLKTYLQQLPANSIERIEVITNPSAKYGAEGTGGIINIVTTSKIKQNSFISFGTFASTRPMVSPWISYMFADKKFSFNVYLNGYFMNYQSIGHGYDLYLNDMKDTSGFQTFNLKNKSNSLAGNLYLNMSYNFDTMNTLSFWGYTYASKSNYLSDNQRYRKDYFPSQIDYNYLINNNGEYYYRTVHGNIWYQHKFNNEGHMLSASLGVNHSGNGQDLEYIRNYDLYDYLDKNKNTHLKNQNTNADFTTDYSIPYIKNGELSLGLTESIYQNKGISYEDTLLSENTDTYILDSMRLKDYISFSNAFQTYVTLQHKFSNFTVKAGFRFQYQQINYTILNSPKDNIKQSYPSLFPSIHISYRTKSMHNFRLSYTRRVSYPEASQLSTFIHYDEESYSLGNPLLEPAFTHALEGGWTKFFNKIGDVGLSAYYKYTKDEISSLSDVSYNAFYGRIVNYSMPVNSGSGYQSGGEIRFNYRLKSLMNIRFYTNLYQSHAETSLEYPASSLRNDTVIITESFSYSFRVNFWTKLFQRLEINASANYHSPTKSLFVENKATYSINGGMRMDFFKRKLSVFLNVQDIFNWNKKEFNTNNPYYQSYNSLKYSSRYIGGGIVLRFGKIEMENMARTGAEQQ